MSLPADLDEAYRLLPTDPARSEALCRSRLAAGDDVSARLLLAGALRLQGDYAGAQAIAAPLARAHPNWPGAQFELAMALGGLGRHAEALDVLRPLTRHELPGIWREIGDRHWALGERTAAEAAYAKHLAAPQHEQLVHEAFAALRQNQRERAEGALRLQLERHPGDVLAMRHLAEVLSSTDRYEESALLLRACLERAPSFHLARFGLAMVYFHGHEPALALEQLELLCAREPGRYEYLNLKADTLARLGEFEAARAVLEKLLALHPNGPWHTYGDTLRALGRRAECEAAYRRAIELKTWAGEAYWGLANLKTFRFQPSDVEAMRALSRELREGEGKTCVLFALGKALEDDARHEEAFQAYSAANAARRARLPHDRGERMEANRRAREVFTAEFFAERAGWGCEAADPIFIVGMPRSGSTLVEQILASHSKVEGTMELIELLAMARRLGQAQRFPELLRDLKPEAVRALGEEYVRRTRVFRKTGAPFFIDKMPNNFTQAGLIHLILPNARIIDVRRHPLACGLSIFKQHWATGQSFAYDLEDIGLQYRTYVELMEHFDAVLPGRVHRVIYERLVEEPERETRRLLDACGLAFEEACLRFYENTRAVRTPSSEQVRRPIFKGGLDQWRPFEPWLDPLKTALGPVLDAYPDAPPLPPL